MTINHITLKARDNALIAEKEIFHQTFPEKTAALAALSRKKFAQLKTHLSSEEKHTYYLALMNQVRTEEIRWKKRAFITALFAAAFFFLLLYANALLLFMLPPSCFFFGFQLVLIANFYLVKNLRSTLPQKPSLETLLFDHYLTLQNDSASALKIAALKNAAVKSFPKEVKTALRRLLKCFFSLSCLRAFFPLKQFILKIFDFLENDAQTKGSFDLIKKIFTSSPLKLLFSSAAKNNGSLIVEIHEKIRLQNISGRTLPAEIQTALQSLMQALFSWKTVSSALFSENFSALNLCSFLLTDPETKPLLQFFNTSLVRPVLKYYVLNCLVLEETEKTELNLFLQKLAGQIGLNAENLNHAFTTKNWDAFLNLLLA
ncbi:MAG: hypothetical protein WC371_04310 [Parachlamydiales bacterium]|jgi:hypothetical protein